MLSGSDRTNRPTAQATQAGRLWGYLPIRVHRLWPSSAASSPRRSLWRTSTANSRRTSAPSAQLPERRARCTVRVRVRVCVRARGASHPSIHTCIPHICVYHACRAYRAQNWSVGTERAQEAKEPQAQRTLPGKQPTAVNGAAEHKLTAVFTAAASSSIVGPVAAGAFFLRMRRMRLVAFFTFLHLVIGFSTTASACNPHQAAAPHSRNLRRVPEYC